MPDFVDPYIDPETGILRNLLGAKTQADLDYAEAEHAVVRLMELQNEPVRVTSDARQLREIHRRLFADVYDWAGQFRIVDINKAGTDFMPVSRVELGAQNALTLLADERALKGLSRDEFIQRLAFHYDQINYLHPFREGNGRTQRVFWQQIAKLPDTRSTSSRWWVPLTTMRHEPPQMATSNHCSPCSARLSAINRAVHPEDLRRLAKVVDRRDPRAARVVSSLLDSWTSQTSCSNPKASFRWRALHAPPAWLLAPGWTRGC